MGGEDRRAEPTGRRAGGTRLRERGLAVLQLLLTRPQRGLRGRQRFGDLPPVQLRVRAARDLQLVHLLHPLPLRLRQRAPGLVQLQRLRLQLRERLLELL